MRRCLVLALTAATVAVAAGDTHAAPAAKPLRQILAVTHAPGGVLLVRTPAGTSVAAAGYADLRRHVRMKAATRFRIGSISKTYIATTILQLAGAGVLTLHDTLEQWLPGRVPDGSAITVRMLLTHTSGLRDDGSSVKPGGWRYANRNFDLLGAIAAKASSRPLARLLADQIFRPNRLKATAWPTSAVPRGLAHGYVSLRPLKDATAETPSRLPPSWALVSSAADVASFLRDLLGGSLLTPPLLAQMKTVAVPIWTDPPSIVTGYGLGLERFETPCGLGWGHRGSIDGYESWAFASDDGSREAVLLLNVGPLADAVANSAVDPLLARAFCG